MQTHCANCDIVVRWKATVARGLTFCCDGCAAGGPCECDYGHLPLREPVIRRIRVELTGYFGHPDSDTSLTLVQRGSNSAPIE